MTDIQIDALNFSGLLQQFFLDEKSRVFDHRLERLGLTEEPHLVLRHNASPSALGWFRAAVFGSELWGARGMTRGEKSVDPPDEWE